MCGIAGIAGGGGPDPALLQRMAAAMAHRGPDGEGVWHDDEVGLAHRRLAIIDLDPRSDQPFHLGPLHLVFNGEIYNYRELREELRGRGHQFRTEGDTEVLLHAWAEWGEGALERIDGMFAFAVWDDAERTLTLARDAFGEKPLHYAERGGRLVFASEIKALLADPAVEGRPDEAALGAYLARAALPLPGETFYADVRAVPAAHVLRWQDGRARLRQWWRPRPVETPARYEDAVAELRELLRGSVSRRLRSDVPVGSSLSGGIDSSAVVGVASELAGDHRRHAFTARFPGFERDEWRYAAAVAEAAGVVEHHAVEPTADALLAELEALVRAHDEPINSTSIYAQWCVMRAAREAGVVVLLDGQGGDELLGGYQGMAGYALRSAGAGAVLRAPGSLRDVAYSLAVERLPRAAARAWRRRVASPYATRAHVEAAARIEPPYLGWFGGADPLRRELLLQAFVTSLPELLRYADRNSMAFSREVRLPLLDRRVAEYALSLPAAFLIRDGLTKRPLRDAVRGLVPELVLGRRDKVGYATPQQRWLATEPFRDLARELLLDPGARTAAHLERAAVEADLRAGAWRDHAGIWRALCAELWLRAVARPAVAA